MPSELQSITTDSNGLPLDEALVAVSEVLVGLHDANIMLQNRIGQNIEETHMSLIEDLQVLDRKAQITLDLVECLRRLADAAPSPSPIVEITRERLFKLDATRRELDRSTPVKGTSPEQKPDDIWL